jgi:hypothetical protein
MCLSNGTGAVTAIAQVSEPPFAVKPAGDVYADEADTWQTYRCDFQAFFDGRQRPFLRLRFLEEIGSRRAVIANEHQIQSRRRNRAGYRPHMRR